MVQLGWCPAWSQPRPDWVITDLGAVDQDLGILKSGNEADVHVVPRWGSRQ
jgi:RIO kinase 1